jgi:hypothetical protein
VPPQRHQRVRREIVGRVRLTRQQVGEAGEFGVVPLEERVECGRVVVGPAAVLDGHAHGHLFLPGPPRHGAARA